MVNSSVRKAPKQPAAALGSSIIELRGVSKTFTVKQGALTVLDHLSCAIEQRSFLSVVGPSGCGKSTLLRLIAGLDTPTAGEIIFNGTLISGPPKGMIYVFQQYSKSIFPWRTVIQNIEFGLASQKTLGRREVRERCLEYIHLVGLDGYEDYFPNQISGGMQQRVAIARALICEPDVLLMDEPFSAVDAMTRAILQELILRIWGELPVTILFVTHDVEEAVFLSSRIISLGGNAQGIVEDLTVDLPYPRDPIRTREDQRFVILRQKLFSSIFTQEKSLSDRVSQRPHGSR